MPRPTFPDRKLEDVNRAYAAVLASGFATADFPGQPEAETLQCRNELDRTNWLGLVVACQANIAAENPDGLTTIRCTSNRMYDVTYAETLGRMYVLLGQAQAAQQNWWRMKDLVRDALTNADLRAIDLTEGWP